jgi:hypothetical protein
MNQPPPPPSFKTARDLLTSDMECIASPFRDDGSVSVQLRTVRLNGIWTMEVAKSLVEFVTKLSSDVEQLRNDKALKVLGISRHRNYVRKLMVCSTLCVSTDKWSSSDVTHKRIKNPHCNITNINICTREKV